MLLQARDIGMLQEALKTLDLETAKYHIDRYGAPVWLATTFVLVFSSFVLSVCGEVWR